MDFGRCRSSQTLVRSQVGVVVKPEMEPLLEIGLDQGFERAKFQRVFECSPESFDDRNGAVLTDGTEALPRAEPAKGFAKSLRRELLSLIGGEVLGRTEPVDRGSEQPGHVSCGGRLVQKLGRAPDAAASGFRYDALQ